MPKTGTRQLTMIAMTASNIEPFAREMAERICRRSGMAEADIPRWVDLHWPCAAAMLSLAAEGRRRRPPDL